MASQPIYQFYAELDDFAPLIWRRFQVAGNITMAQLGYIVMTMFEMQAGHLYALEILPDEELSENMRELRELAADGGKSGGNVLDVMPQCDKISRYEMPNMESFLSDDDRYLVFDSTKHKLSQTTLRPKGRLNFNYDFGDDWWILLALESVTVDKALPGRDLPRVLEGGGYGIVDDCGGTSGLTELVQAFKKKKGKAYLEFSEWLERDSFDITAFDMDDMNFRLKKIPRIYADIYERHVGPTDRAIALLERKYLKK
ncbi:MAG: plasmid pRiA4b ORF-3 family protein [Synergistaceae bacterium]|jgi:hypothetical protein|nr:plasmid pRiA4b ORF-3 family protein [Synergistaceae bacterium]